MAITEMKAEKIEVKQVSLSRLVLEMEEGFIRVPRFQRVFVWPRARIINLLDSMYKEYPIGTIFLWEAPSEYNHLLRTVEYLGQPKAKDEGHYSLILDGQQRLTSLYAVIKCLEIENDDFGRIVFDLDPSEPGNFFRYRQPDNKRWISVSDIIMHKYEVFENLESSEYQKRFSMCHRLLTNYPFSVVIAKGVKLDEAIEIFERINQAGKRLTRYDLITASVLTDDFDLREKTDQEVIGPLTERFGEISETNIPQTLALIIKGNTEHKTQMDLQAEDVQHAWPDTVNCLMQARNVSRRLDNSSRKITEQSQCLTVSQWVD